MLDMYRTKKDQLQRIHNFAKLVQVGLRNLGYTGLPTRLRRTTARSSYSASEPSSFLHKRASFVPSFVAGSPTLSMARRTTRSGTKSRGTLKLTSRIMDGAINEEDPDTDIDELDFFSDED